MILFSMPVHENNDVVRMGLDNIRRYVKDFTVVIHVSASFADFDETIRNIPNVIINPIRSPTKYGFSQLGIHMQSFRLAAYASVPFTHFCVYHTSEMFVKHGVEDLIKQHEFSSWYNKETMPRDTPWQPLKHAHRFKLFDELVPDRSWLVGHVIEGMWISRRLMERIYQWTISVKGLLEITVDWPVEEMVLPTLAHWFGRDISYGEPYNAFFEHTLTVENINDILQGKSVELQSLNQFNTTGVPILSDGYTKFSVKRFNRLVDDPVRQYVLGLVDKNQ